MEAVVAVYSDWGIGARGTQPVVLSADRVRFRELTTGCAVIVGRKTLEDFPGGRPLKNRDNIVVTRQDIEIPGAAAVVHGTGEAIARAEEFGRCFVIGGASVFLQFFPHLSRVYVTKLDIAPHSDSFFPNLDEDRGWRLAESEPRREENGVGYQFCVYEKI